MWAVLGLFYSVIFLISAILQPAKWDPKIKNFKEKPPTKNACTENLDLKEEEKSNLIESDDISIKDKAESQINEKKLQAVEKNFGLKNINFGSNRTLDKMQPTENLN